MTLAKDQCRLDIKKYSFSQRTINESGYLPWTAILLNLVNSMSDILKICTGSPNFVLPFGVFKPPLKCNYFYFRVIGHLYQPRHFRFKCA